MPAGSIDTIANELIDIEIHNRDKEESLTESRYPVIL